MSFIGMKRGIIHIPNNLYPPVLALFVGQYSLGVESYFLFVALNLVFIRIHVPTKLGLKEITK